MDEKLLKYLYDVLGAVEEINSYFEGKPKLFEAKEYELRKIQEIVENHATEFQEQYCEHIGKRIDD